MCFKEIAEGIIITIKVTPSSKKCEIVGWDNDILKIRLVSIPEKGKANQELVNFLAKIFKIPKSSIKLTKGESNRTKVVLLPKQIATSISLLTGKE